MYRNFVGFGNHFFVRVGFNGEFPACKWTKEIFDQINLMIIYFKKMFTLFSEFVEHLRKSQSRKCQLEDN